MPKISPPTQVADIVFDEDIREFAESIVEVFGFDFFVQIEIGRDLKGNPGLIEINTRLDAALPITTGLGLNFYHEMITYAVTTKMREDIKDFRSHDSRLCFKRYWQHLFEDINNGTT
jgi:biotin carboxylase